MEFTWFKSKLEALYLTNAAAGRICGRSSTTVGNWIKGLGLQDINVQRCIAQVTGESMNTVKNEIAAYNALVQKQSTKLPASSLGEAAKKIKDAIHSCDYYDSGRRMSREEKAFLIKRVDEYYSQLLDFQSLIEAKNKF